MDKTQKEEKKYMHIVTGEVDTRDGWMSSYDDEELSLRDISAMDAFESDLGQTLLEVTK